MFFRKWPFLLSVVFVVSLGGCKSYLGQAEREGGSSGSGSCVGSYTVGGTVTGLSGTLVLENNGADDLTLTSNGIFTFVTCLNSGDIYDVTVKSNPSGQVCMVSNNTGVIAGANVTNVSVRCASDTNWVQDAYLKASNAEGGDQFGRSVAISGATIVVGSLYEDSNQTTITNTDGVASANNDAVNSGAVYVFQRDSTGTKCTIPAGESWCWFQDAYLKASNAEANDNFGWSVAISGSTIVVGAYGESSNQTTITNTDGIAPNVNGASTSGAVYVFQRDANGNWYQDAYLKASNAEAFDNFGYKVSISGSTIAVGGYLESSDQKTITNEDGVASTNNDALESGAVYVFKAF